MLEPAMHSERIFREPECVLLRITISFAIAETARVTVRSVKILLCHSKSRS